MTTKQSILVTGGASGIGLAIVQAIVERGWTVTVADVNSDSLDQARTHLTGGAERIRYERLDVTDEAAVAQAIARCDTEAGPLTGVVNSAGIASDIACLDT